MQINISEAVIRHLDPNQQVDDAHESVHLDPKKVTELAYTVSYVTLKTFLELLIVPYQVINYGPV